MSNPHVVKRIVSEVRFSDNHTHRRIIKYWSDGHKTIYYEDDFYGLNQAQKYQKNWESIFKKGESRND